MNIKAHAPSLCGSERRREAPPKANVLRRKSRPLLWGPSLSPLPPKAQRPQRAAEAQSESNGSAEIHWVGEARWDWGGRCFRGVTLPLSIGFLSGSFPSPAADRSCTEGGRPGRGARQAPCNRPSACGARRPPLPQLHGYRACSSKGGLEGRGQRAQGAAEAGPGPARACWGRGLLGAEQKRWANEGRSQGHALELRGPSPCWAE